MSAFIHSLHRQCPDLFYELSQIPTFASGQRQSLELLPLPTFTLHVPRGNIDGTTNRHRYASEDLEIDILALVPRDQRSTDWIATQSGEGNNKKVCPVSHPDLADI